MYQETQNNKMCTSGKLNNKNIIIINSKICKYVNNKLKQNNN